MPGLLLFPLAIEILLPLLLSPGPPKSFPGVGLGASSLLPVADERLLGVLGGNKLGRPEGGCLLTGDSGLLKLGRAGVLPIVLLPNARPAGDSGRREGVGNDGGVRPENPVSVGVGGGLEDAAELRLEARFRGTNMPDKGVEVVKYRTL